MSSLIESVEKPVIVGRSSSHFTRIVRIFAVELRVDYSFRTVRDLLSTDLADYAGHPGLKIPTLQTVTGTWFGALNICRELSRLSSERRVIAWPETLHGCVLANAQELTLQAMATEVNLIMNSVGGGVNGNAYQAKATTSLRNMLSWLEASAGEMLDRLPRRDLSFLEVALFCLMEHLEFRKILPIDHYPALNGFRRDFASRASAVATAYKFD